MEFLFVGEIARQVLDGVATYAVQFALADKPGLLRASRYTGDQVRAIACTGGSALFQRIPVWWIGTGRNYWRCNKSAGRYLNEFF
jgi:hypothetical protein